MMQLNARAIKVARGLIRGELANVRPQGLRLAQTISARPFSDSSKKGAVRGPDYVPKHNPVGYAGAGHTLHVDIKRKPEQLQMSEAEYIKALQKTLSEIEVSANEMKKDNPDMVIERSETSLTIYVNDKEYYIRRGGSGTKTLVFRTPLSGARSYILAAKGDERVWVDENDGHDFYGLFVRDFMKNTYGLPSFATKS